MRKVIVASKKRVSNVRQGTYVVRQTWCPRDMEREQKDLKIKKSRNKTKQKNLKFDIQKNNVFFKTTVHKHHSSLILCFYWFPLVTIGSRVNKCEI